MCGRYTLAGNMIHLEKHFRAKLSGHNFSSSFNIAPGQKAPIILNTAKEIIGLHHWGLVPYWIKRDEKPIKLINTRTDSLLTKPGFKNYLKRKRCLIPSSGFYEWKPMGKLKQAYYFNLPEKEFFSFAGIWEEYANEDGELIYTYSILTTDANSLVAPIHNRMPVILNQNDEDKWLNDSDFNRLSTLLIPFPKEEMNVIPVSNRVNSAANNDESLIEEVSPSTLF